MKQKYNPTIRSCILKTLAICGIVGPILYAVVIITIGSLHPNYHHILQSMSELGAVDAPYALIMNTLGFPLLGLSIVAFAIAIDFGIHRNKASRAGPGLLILSGVSLLMTGIFRCDSECTVTTWVGSSHRVFAIVSAISFSLAWIFIAIRQYSDSRWRRYIAFSLITGLITFVSSMLYTLHIFESYVGLLQRLNMGLPLLWMDVISIRLLYIHSQRS